MALKNNWQDKIDGKDDILAKDINDMANSIIELEEKSESSEETQVIQFTNGFRIEAQEGSLRLFDSSGHEYLLCLADHGIEAVYADEAGFSEWAALDTESRPLKGISVQDYGDIDVAEMALSDGYHVSYGIVSELLSVNAAGEWVPGGLTMELEFTTPSEIPENYSQIENVYFKGDSTEDEGYFVPEPNTRYTIVFSFNGNMVVGYVSGIPAPSVREVTE